MTKSNASDSQSAPALISQRIASLTDWRGTTLARMRKLIKEADADVVEEWKWMGTPVWSRDGIICTGESYKSVVKLTFMKGASLEDPAGLFNSSLDGNARRAIALNGRGTSKPAKTAKVATRAKAAKSAKPPKAAKPATAAKKASRSK